MYPNYVSRGRNVHCAVYAVSVSQTKLVKSFTSRSSNTTIDARTHTHTLRFRCDLPTADTRNDMQFIYSWGSFIIFRLNEYHFVRGVCI